MRSSIQPSTSALTYAIRLTPTWIGAGNWPSNAMLRNRVLDIVVAAAASDGLMRRGAKVVSFWFNFDLLSIGHRRTGGHGEPSAAKHDIQAQIVWGETV